MRIVVLTGAGISAESGVPTFRDADGLWEGHRVEDVATPAAYDRQPDVVHRFYDARRAALATVEPNPAHHALARLEAAFGDDLLVVTQNIDDLHERAGSTRVLHMHGELRSALCRSCGIRVEWEGDLGDLPPCPSCHEVDLRPDVVWFGEIPYDLDRIFAALEEATSSCPSAPPVRSTRRRASSMPRRSTAPARSSSTWSRARAVTSSTRPGTAAPARSCLPGSTSYWGERLASRLR